MQSLCFLRRVCFHEKNVCIKYFAHRGLFITVKQGLNVSVFKNMTGNGSNFSLKPRLSATLTDKNL